MTQLAEGAAWHYVTDHLGTPQELYDEQREVVWAADLSAYGRTARRLAHAVDNPIRFPGQYYDRESGLHYNPYRYTHLFAHFLSRASEPLAARASGLRTASGASIAPVTQPS